MKSGVLFLLAAALALASGCEATLPGESKTPYPTVEQCPALRGTVERRGLVNAETCVIRNPDARRICTDSAQCVGRCLVADDGDRELRRGTLATGRCEESNATLGCFAEVSHGRLTASLCVD
jgi:hypothetical protein